MIRRFQPGVSLFCSDRLACRVAFSAWNHTSMAATHKKKRTWAFLSGVNGLGNPTLRRFPTDDDITPA